MLKRLQSLGLVALAAGCGTASPDHIAPSVEDTQTSTHALLLDEVLLRRTPEALHFADDPSAIATRVSEADLDFFVLCLQDADATPECHYWDCQDGSCSAISRDNHLGNSGYVGSDTALLLPGQLARDFQSRHRTCHDNDGDSFDCLNWECVGNSCEVSGVARGVTEPVQYVGGVNDE